MSDFRSEYTLPSFPIFTSRLSTESTLLMLLNSIIELLYERIILLFRCNTYLVFLLIEDSNTNGGSSKINTNVISVIDHTEDFLYPYE